ncbi:MAG: hypothetical protein QXI16_01465 [Sulfolobaceae archaeon]
MNDEDFKPFENKCNEHMKQGLANGLLYGPNEPRVMCVISDNLRLREVGKLLNACDKIPKNFTNIQVDNIVKESKPWSSVTCLKLNPNQKQNTEISDSINEWMKSIGFYNYVGTP